MVCSSQHKNKLQNFRMKLKSSHVYFKYIHWRYIDTCELFWSESLYAAFSKQSLRLCDRLYDYEF